MNVETLHAHLLGKRARISDPTLREAFRGSGVEVVAEGPADAEILVVRHSLDDAGKSRILAEALGRAAPELHLVMDNAASRTKRALSRSGRESWELAAIRSGYLLHPERIAWQGYAEREFDPPGRTFVSFLLPDEGRRGRNTLEALLAERDLHMDMLRETGRRSDAHLVRYEAARRIVRPGDVVLDAACGMGYGSAMLARRVGASGKVIGVDLSEPCVRYASDMHASPNVEFHVADATHIEFIADGSVDLVTSFETLEHVPDPVALLREFHRVLRPGGRIVASVPNDWRDETGEDPNPWHLHVYDWARFLSEISKDFIPELGIGQLAGGGRALPKRSVHVAPRDWFLFSPDRGPERDAEWWVAVAMKDPLAPDPLPKAAPPDAPAHLLDFGASYRHPALVDAIVGMNRRIMDAVRLAAVIEEGIGKVAPGSCDEAALLAVKGYAALRADTATAAAALIDCERWLANPAQHAPHAIRWKLSLGFLAGKLARKTGDDARAATLFLAVAESDFSAFGPTIVTKAVAAGYEGALACLSIGRRDEAERACRAGIQSWSRAMASPPEAFLGSVGHPFWFPVFETIEAAVASAACVDILRSLRTGSPVRSLKVENLYAQTGWNLRTELDLGEASTSVRRFGPWLTRIRSIRLAIQGKMGIRP